MEPLTPHEQEIIRLWGVIRNLLDKPMDHPVAVISSDYYETMNWIQNNWQVKVNDSVRNRITLVDGRVLMIVTNREQAMRHEFSDYLIAPNFTSLVDVVKTRIR